MKGQKILKVTSILMIIGGVIAVVVGVLAILGISALAALSGSTEGIGLLYASIGACSDSQKAASCIKWGIIIAILTIISMIIGLVGGGTFSITSLVLNLLLPGLYVYGAVQVKNSITA